MPQKQQFFTKKWMEGKLSNCHLSKIATFEDMILINILSRLLAKNSITRPNHLYLPKIIIPPTAHHIMNKLEKEKEILPRYLSSFWKCLLTPPSVQSKG